MKWIDDRTYEVGNEPDPSPEDVSLTEDEWLELQDRARDWLPAEDGINESRMAWLSLKACAHVKSVDARVAKAQYEVLHRASVAIVEAFKATDGEFYWQDAVEVIHRLAKDFQ